MVSIDVTLERWMKIFIILSEGKFGISCKNCTDFFVWDLLLLLYFFKFFTLAAGVRHMICSYIGG